MKGCLVILSTSLVACLFLVTFLFLETAAPRRLKDLSHQAGYHPEYAGLKQSKEGPSARHAAALGPAEAAGEAPAVDHNYYGTFATFTENFPLLDNKPYIVKGSWKEKQYRPKLLANFVNRRGAVEGSFEYIPGIRKTLFHLTIFDEVYYDSNSVELTINLKMSKFDEATSTFTIHCSEGDEYFAWGVFTEKTLDTKTVNYFDFDMKLSFRELGTDAPFKMRQMSPDLNSLLVDFEFKSESLKFSVAGDLKTGQPATTNTLLYWTVIFLNFMLFILSFSCNSNISQDFIPNVGAEALAMISLFNFHHFVAYLQLSRVNKHYIFFSYAMAVISLGQAFAMMASGIFFLAIDDTFRRNMHANNREALAQRERYMFFLVSAYLSGLFLIAIYSPTMIFKSYYDYFLYFVFSFPLLQVVITFMRRVNKIVFSPVYHLLVWWIPLFPLLLWKGVPNPLVNMSPNRTLVIYAAAGLAFATGFMFIQSKFGLYFFLPTDWIPGNMNMRRPVNQIPKEKLEEICSICYSALKYDVAAPDEHVELQEAGLENSDLLPHSTEIFVTPCNHYYHVNCLATWLTTKKQTCPLCNRLLIYIE